MDFGTRTRVTSVLPVFLLRVAELASRWKWSTAQEIPRALEIRVFGSSGSHGRKCMANVFSNRPKLSGFARKSFAPANLNNVCASVLTTAETAMIGLVLDNTPLVSIARISFVAVSPSLTGIDWSMRMASISASCWVICSIAAAPSSARTT